MHRNQSHQNGRTHGRLHLNETQPADSAALPEIVEDYQFTLDAAMAYLSDVQIASILERLELMRGRRYES